MPGGVQAVVELSGGLYILPDAVAAAGLVYGDRVEIEVGDGHIGLRLDTECVRTVPAAPRRPHQDARSEPRFATIARSPDPIVVAGDVASIDGA